jgi:hypothetical protein
MTTTTTEPVVTPAALAYLLGNDDVLIAARKILEAKLRKQALYGTPNEDTSMNGQPRRVALARADADAAAACRDIGEAIERAADRYVREETR